MLRLCRYARFGLILALMIACAAEWAPAQSQIIRPRRLVRLFDFEEPNNYESLPKNWFIIGRVAETTDSTFFREPLHHDLMERAGFPSFTEVRFDRTHAFSGERSLYLGLNGGSAGGFLEVGAIPVVPQSDYLITAVVRTESLKHAAACLSVYFVDRHGKRIEDSLVTSKHIRTHGAWTEVALKLRGDAEGAVWLGMEAKILQPTRSEKDPLGEQRVLLTDVDGEAWFDDISIWQLPRIEVATQSKVNLIRAPEKPNVSISVRDLTSQSLNVVVTAYDYNLKPAAVEHRRLEPGTPRFWVWKPDLPAYGWYLIDMQVRDHEAKGPSRQTQVARTFGAFVWLPPGSNLNPVDEDRFKLIATGMSEKQLAFLPELLDATGIRSTVLSIWDRQTTLGDVEARKERIDAMMKWLYLSGRSAALSLDPVPAALAEAIDDPAADPLVLIAAERNLWMAYLTPTLLNHGQRVARWYMGSTDQTYLFYNQDLPEDLQGVHEQFANMVASPELVIPWRLDQQRRHDLPETTYYIMDTPPGIRADQIQTHLKPWQDIKDHLTLALREPPADLVSHNRRVTDLAIRMLHAWEAQPDSLAMGNLWAEAAQRDTALVPDPLLGVYANMAQRLAGRRVVGKLNVGGGVSVWVLDGPAGPAMMAWADQPGSPQSVMHMYLGQRPIAIDVWGNPKAVPESAGKHRLDVPATPVMITGIDAQLALFRAGFSIDEPFIESTQTLHERVFTITNPWKTNISGHMQITGPDGWESKPTRQFFSIPAGRSITLPMALSYPVSEVAGRHKLTARFEFTANDTMVIDTALPVEVGLKDVRFNATVALNLNSQTGAEDVTAAAVVTNTGNQKLSLYVFANLRGHPIQERIVADLEPGQSAVRRFKFAGAGQALRDTPMRLGVREIDGPRMLNQRLGIDQNR